MPSPPQQWPLLTGLWSGPWPTGKREIGSRILFSTIPYPSASTASMSSAPESGSICGVGKMKAAGGGGGGWFTDKIFQEASWLESERSQQPGHLAGPCSPSIRIAKSRIYSLSALPLTSPATHRHAKVLMLFHYPFIYP